MLTFPYSISSPFCNTFPLEVSCTVPNVGLSGGNQDNNGVCILSQNAINQVLYLVIWFYMVFLILISPICICYRVCTLKIASFRSALLMGKIWFDFETFWANFQTLCHLWNPPISGQLGNTKDKDERMSVKEVMRKCYISDWFVLFQLSKNVNMYFFREFIKELKNSFAKKEKIKEV